MREAATVLGVLRERGRRRLPLERIYRLLFSRELYLLAYGRLYSNKGSMTPGSDSETVDGMSLDKIDRIIDALRHERYRFKPVRRTYIPKKNGKKRPLGLPSWSDKLVGEVIRLILEAYYEPTFSDHSHGYRPGRGCHTALSEVRKYWTGTTWFIEGDIADCFGMLDHKIMLSIIAENFHDGRFLRLLHNMLQAGYLEDWVYHPTLSGAPQGGVTSPCLSNVYLSKLDSFVENILIPEYTRGINRAPNPDYQEIERLLVRARRRGDRPAVRALRRQRRGMPSKDTADPGFRRLRYVRYCDDHLLGFTGPKAEAEEIKTRIAGFLRDNLGLELSRTKTLITHARTGTARFLGYGITVQHADHMVGPRGRTINGTIGLRVPRDVIKAKSAPFLQRGKPERRSDMVNEGDLQIIQTYDAEYRGLVNYYLLAGDVYRLNRLEWVMKTSMLKTLAAKHDSTVTRMADRYKTTIPTPHGPRRCFEATLERDGRPPLVARFGGIPLKCNKNAVLVDRVPAPVKVRRKEVVARLEAGRCELCQQTSSTVSVHHVRKLTDLATPGTQQPVWNQLMAKRRRKTLIVCGTCHDTIHGHPTAPTTQ
jgi:group II intron reverse transcriptase/maturase